MSKSKLVSKPKKRWLRWALIAFALIVIAFTAAIYLLSQDRERLTSFLREQIRLELLLDLQVSQPAKIAFWPQLAVELEGVALSGLDNSQAWMRAETLAVAIPWQSIWTQELALGAIRIDSPDIDGDALVVWLNKVAGANDGPARPLQWPQLNKPLRIRDGVWRQGDLRVEQINLQLDQIRLGEQSELVLGGALSAESTQALKLEASFTPQPDSQGLLAKKLSLLISGESDPTRLLFNGNASWLQIGALQLDGKLSSSAISEQFLAIGLSNRAIQLDMDALVNAKQIKLIANGELFGGALTLDGQIIWPQTSLDLPREQIIQAWLQAFIGKAEIDALEIDGVIMRGISLENLPEVAPVKSP